MKKHLVNVGYFVAMIISALFMLKSCVNLAHAQDVDTTLTVFRFGIDSRIFDSRIALNNFCCIIVE